MVFCAFTSSIDLLSVMPQIPEEKFTRFHNIIKGQGLITDATALLLVKITEKAWERYAEAGDTEM